MVEDLASEKLDDDVDEDLEGGDDTDALDSGGEESTDNIGDPSVEINVEALISELEADGLTGKLGKEQDTRRRLEELMERRRAMRDLEDFDDYDI